MSDSIAGPSALSEPPSLRKLAKSPARTLALADISLDESRLDREVALLVSQWLESRDYEHAARVLEEEVLGIQESRHEDRSEVERAILDGDYASLEAALARPGLLKPRAQKSFLYLCYRQQFLEFIENRESQKAFNLLQKRLKPLEHYQPVPYDFYNLSYLTSASTVHDAPGLRDWAGEGPEREKLVAMWKEMGQSADHGNDEVLGDKDRDRGERERAHVKPGRLVELLKQAAAWQVGRGRRRGDGPWMVSSLLHDYEPLTVPDRLHFMVKHHQANVKCVDHLGRASALGVSGSSDATLRIFSLEDGSTRQTLTGHTSRIWDCSTSPSGSQLASASGDGTVRIWSAVQGDCQTVLQGDGGDVYSVSWRPHRENQLVSASYDRILRSWDVETSKQIRTFSGHSQSTLAVAYNSSGYILASGSKDKQIRLWDAVGGSCIHSISDCLGEITSVQFDRDSKYLLAGCKDNSNRLFDLRMNRNLYRYTGHQNTSKNLIRCSFAASDSLVIGGSEDGMVYIWEREASASQITSRHNDNDTHGRSSHTMINQNHHTGSNRNSHHSASGTTGAGASAGAGAGAAVPAYYPPRNGLARTHHSYASQGTNVKPLKVLEGHGEGAVFDVRWCEEGIVSAGEDGCVGLWGFGEDE